MPLCARCFGVAFGQLVAACFFLVGLRPPVAVCVTGPAIMLIDWGAQEYFNRPSTNRRRVITGTAAGLGLGILYCQLIVAVWNIVR
jgi:uncharacterized membrane protein